MNFLLKPTAATGGDLSVPGDKSISHRALMLGAVAEGLTRVEGLLVGEDCLATLHALRAMGVSIERPDETTAVIDGVGLHGLTRPAEELDLGNSGTGMRLFAGLLAGQSFDVTLCGDASLSRRPMGRVITPLTMMGASIESNEGKPPLRISAARQLQGIEYPLPVASAQVKSAVLFAGLYARGETTVIEPAVTRDHSERMLRTMGVQVLTNASRMRLGGGQRLRGGDVCVPADLSSAAFLILAALIAPSAEITIRRVGINPTRTGAIDILRDMGANINVFNQQMMGEEPVADLTIRSSTLHAISVTADRVSLAIDEFPVLFVAAAVAQGTSRFAGLEELRVKESDRVAAMVAGLKALGITAKETPQGAEILGGSFAGGRVDSHGDHRIAMAFAVAASVATDTVEIADVAAVDTSFPGFLDCMRSIGLDIESVASAGE